MHSNEIDEASASESESLVSSDDDIERLYQPEVQKFSTGKIEDSLELLQNFDEEFPEVDESDSFDVPHPNLKRHSTPDWIFGDSLTARLEEKKIKYEEESKE